MARMLEWITVLEATEALASLEVLDINLLNNLIIRMDMEDRAKLEEEVLLEGLTWVMIIKMAMVTVTKRCSQILGNTIIPMTLEELAKTQQPIPILTIGNHSILITCRHLITSQVWVPTFRVQTVLNATFLNISNNHTSKSHPLVKVLDKEINQSDQLRCLIAEACRVEIYHQRWITNSSSSMIIKPLQVEEADHHLMLVMNPLIKKSRSINLKREKPLHVEKLQ